ncbi:MAG TPA: hypothetical protein VKU82_03460, partial [Planctomycetaceae bacterium]|nr:hypothetical protein [Planctomycetaceae bacterium]
DRTKEDIRHYFARVDAVIARRLHDEEAPLILACVEYLAPIYKSVNRSSGLVDAIIKGSPAQLAPDEIHSRAWRILDGRTREATKSALGRLGSQIGLGRASTDVREIVLAADDGRVDTLLVARGAHRWGRVDGAARTVAIANEQNESDGRDREELLDFAAARTLSCRGEVHAVESIPDTDSPLAATFRY